MAVISDLRGFLRLLHERGELRRVPVEVSPVHEIAEIVDRTVKAGGPALLFEHVAGHTLPVAVNLFGTRRRMSLALGVDDLEEVARRLEELIELPRRRAKGLLTLLPHLKELAATAPRRARSGPCQEVVWTGSQVDLHHLPVLTAWPGDAGPFITLPLVISRDPIDGTNNVGMYRVQVLDGQTAALHWQLHKVGAHQFARAQGRFPVAIALGGDPATTYAASAPLPPGMSEFAFAGFLRRAPVELCPARTVDLDVPANAEIVIEGWADTAEPPCVEGPFGDHTGFYSPADHYPALHVTAITMRRDPVYPTTVAGPPPMEDYFFGLATERIFRPLVRAVLPEVVDFHLPPEGVLHNLAFVAIDKRYPGQAYKVAQGLLGLGMMSLTKMVVVVDAEVNVQDTAATWCAALNNADPERDVLITRGPIDVLDHAVRLPAFGGKLILDGTRKLPGEGHTRPWPERIVMSPEIRALVDSRWASYGIS